MFILLRKKFFIYGLCALLFLLAATVLLFTPSVRQAFSSQEEKVSTVILDAGHGGEDGGAVALDGTVESAINLAVAKRLQEVFFFLGVPCQMTREEDIDLSDQGLSSTRERKRSDLENRVELINSIPEGELISIHQNSLPNYFSVHGAQAFYREDEQSRQLAEAIQNALNLSINTEKGKVCKQIDSSIYLMSHVDCTAVLVECGFLSNQEETALLQQSPYQTCMALTIASGYLSYKNPA